MSAWLCSPNHIGEICRRSGQVSGYNPITRERYDMDASTLAGLLAHQNLLSLQARYPEMWEDFLSPFEGDDTNERKINFIWQCQQQAKQLPKRNKQDCVGLIRSYRYQACETDNWIETDSYWIIEGILDDLYSDLVETTLWSYEDEEVVNV